MRSFMPYLMAAFYDRVMGKIEQHCLGVWRAELLGGVDGSVMEIGSGTGVNLAYYPSNLDRLVFSEPETYMRRQLCLRLQKAQAGNVEVKTFRAENIDLPDASFDYAVSTLVLCSVRDPLRALMEIRRILKPGGHLVFLEHVAASKDSSIFLWQRRIEPVWKFCAGNCHLTRQTAAIIHQAGFEPVQLEHVLMESAPALVRSVIKGMARKPG